MRRRKFLALAASAAALPQFPSFAQVGTRQPRPLEDFAALPFMQGPELSPDGNKYAAKLAVRGEQYFAVSSLFEGGAPVLIPSGGRDINWWSWVNDAWLVVGIGALDHVEGVDMYVRRVVGISADGTKLVPLLFREAGQGADNVIWIADDGSPRIRVAVQKSVYIDNEDFWPQVLEVDVSTGRSKLIVRPTRGVTSWYADGTGAVRMGIGRADDGRSLRLLYRDRDGSGFRTLDKANTRKGEKLLVPALFLKEAGQALVFDDKSGFDAIYKLDLKTLEIGERVFGVDGYDVDDIISDSTRSGLLGVGFTENGPRVHWFDSKLAELQTAVEKAVPGRRARVLSMDAKQQRFLIALDSPDHPGTIYFMDGDDGRLQRLAHVNDRIGASRLNPVKTIRYAARDGLQITAILTLPAGREAKMLPVVVMPHGGPFSRDSEDWDWWGQFLADRGYAVVQPNFRGSSGFGKAFAEKGEGQWGLAMQDDVNDALGELVKQGIADPKRAAIVGASYGGYAAMRAAQRDGALYRCAVSFAGVSDLPALLRYDRAFLNSGRAVDWLKTQAPDLKAVSPINFPESFSSPILLVHGKLDRRVPVKQSRELAEKLKKAGKPHKYVEQPKGDHHFSRQEDRLAFLKELETFLAAHNPA